MSVKYFDKEQNKWVAFPGTQGAPGEDAYDIAVRNGFKGTYEEYVEMISKMPGYIEDIEGIIDGSGAFVKAEGDINEDHLAVFKDNNTIKDGGITIKDVIDKVVNGLEGDLIDPSMLSASVENVVETDGEVLASVNYEDKNFAFSFGIPKGIKGDKGDKGDTGESGVSARTVLAFTTSDTKPARPVGGSWDILTNEVTLPSGWSMSDEIAKPVWMCSGIFYNADPDNPVWGDTSLISGTDGDNGADGTSVEFIYKLTPDHTNIYKPERPTQNTQTDVAPEGWTDSPSGISEEMQCEWFCTRKWSDNGWSDWDGPYIWSKWGANGLDGDGVQYVYYLNDGEPVSNPTISDYATNDAYQEIGAYDGVEYCPASPWTDEPSGVTPDNKCEWVSVRKFRDGKWGPYSDPKLWAKYGEDGISGLVVKTWYAKTASSSVIPPFNPNDPTQPGGAWTINLNVLMGNYTYPEAIWSVSAYFDRYGNFAETLDENGNKIKGWQGPIIISGTKGDDGTAPVYKTYFYKKSSTASDKPSVPPKSISVKDVINYGWEDYPDDYTGYWWQVIGTVDGKTDFVVDWSAVQPMFGSGTEFRFAIGDLNTYPTLNKTSRNPANWDTDTPEVPEDKYMWMTMAQLNADGSLNGSWSSPVRISGERGPKGEVGPTGGIGPSGPIGVTGVSMEFLYCTGTETAPDKSYPEYTSGSDSKGYTKPSGWVSDAKTLNLTGDSIYVWCLQGKKTYNDDNNTYKIYWQSAFRVTGLMGAGATGNPGLTIYPAGIWSPNETYYIDYDNNLCPYVWYNNAFYILNAEFSTKGQNPTVGNIWTPVEMFEAIYADVGIINQALVGSAVFHKEYVYSQQGALNGKNADYTDASIENGFVPNILFNFKTGAGHLAGGAISFDSDGTLKFGDIDIPGSGGSGDVTDYDRIQDMIDNSISGKADADDIPDVSSFITSSDVNIILNKKNYATKDQIISASDVVKELDAQDIADIINGDKLIDGTAIKDGSIATEHIIANDAFFNAVVSNRITADNISGGSLNGLTIMSHNTESDSLWVLRDDGTARIGKVGSGMTINSDGSATFSVDSISGEKIVDQQARDDAAAAIANANAANTGLSSLKTSMSNGTTTIHGGCITTGKINAKYLDISVPSDADIETIAQAKAESERLALEGKLASGTTTIISGGCIETGSIAANKITGFTIEGNTIKCDTLIAGSAKSANTLTGSITVSKISDLNNTLSNYSTTAALNAAKTSLETSISKKADSSSLSNYATKTEAQNWASNAKDDALEALTNAPSGSTKINGGWIDTNAITISSSNVDGLDENITLITNNLLSTTNVIAEKIKATEISADKISGGTLDFDNFNVKNLNVSDSLIVGSKFATNDSLNSAKSELNTSINSKADSSTVSSLSNTVSNLSNTVSNKVDKSSLNNYATKTVAQQYVEDFKTAVGVSTTSGKTTIDGGHIDASTLKVKAANIEGTLIIGNINGLQSELDSKATTSQLNSKADSSTVNTLQNQVNNLPTDSDVTAAANKAQTNAENNITNKLKTKQSATFINGGNIISGSLELSDYLKVGNIDGLQSQLDGKATTDALNTLSTNIAKTYASKDDAQSYVNNLKNQLTEAVNGTTYIKGGLINTNAIIVSAVNSNELKTKVTTITNDTISSTNISADKISGGTIAAECIDANKITLYEDGKSFTLYEYIQYQYNKMNYSTTSTETWYTYSFDEHSVNTNELNYIVLEDGEYQFSPSARKISKVTPVNYINGKPYYATDDATTSSSNISGSWSASGSGGISASIYGDVLFITKNGSGSMSLKCGSGDTASIMIN